MKNKEQISNNHIFNKKYKKFKNILIANTVIAVWTILLLVVSLIVLVNLQFPQRVDMSFMDKQMLKDGEGVFLMYATTAVFVFVASYISLLITSPIVLYRFFFEIIDKKKELLTNSVWWIKLFIGLYCIFYILFPFIFVWFLYIKTTYWVRFFENHSIVYKHPLSNTWKRVIWIGAPTIFSFLIFMILPIFLLISFIPNTAAIRDRRNELSYAYTLSENKPNTLVFYFDRSMGIVWNQLLMVDYLMNKQNSFIMKYPEFSSFVNSLSMSMVTNSSNPSIGGSWYQIPEFKNHNITNPFNLTNDNSVSMNDWFLDGYENLIGMLSKHNYEHFSIINPPYYAKRDYELNANAKQLQSDLNRAIKNNEIYPNNYNSNRAAKDVYAFDVTEIAKSLGYNAQCDKNDEIHFINNFAASTNDKTISNPKNEPTKNYGNNINLEINNNADYVNLSVSNQKNSTFLWVYFQSTHEEYQYISNPSMKSKENPAGINYDNVDVGEPIISDRTPNNFVISCWYSIKKLERIFSYLKSLPANDPNRPWVSNQYDNSNIYIISDHGTPLVNKQNLYWDLNRFLVKNNAMTQKQMDYLQNVFFNYDEMSFSFWNSIFLRKPAKYSNKNWNLNNNSPEKFFNLTQLYTNADLVPIIESDVMKQNYDMNHPNSVDYSYNMFDSWFFNQSENDIYRPKSSNKRTQDLIDKEFNNNFILNPLENKKMDLNSRQIPLYYTNWIFIPSSKNYQFYYKYYFVNKYPGSIFNVKNFVRTSI